MHGGGFDERADAFYADWRRGEGIRRLNSGRAYSGLLRFAPGLGKAFWMLTGGPLESAAHARQHRGAAFHIRSRAGARSLHSTRAS